MRRFSEPTTLMAPGTRKDLPLLEFSEPLHERILELHPIAKTIEQFYDRHVHDVRVTSSRLLRDANRAVESITKTELPMLEARLTGSLTRLIAALVRFEKDNAMMGEFAGVTSPKAGRRAKHVHLWIAGTLQGEAEACYGRDLRLPWRQIEACLREDLGEQKYGSLAKDVDRNRDGVWFRDARKAGLANNATWPGLTRLRTLR